MEPNWHHAFNPQLFLKKINLDQLLTKNDAYAENRINKLGKPCLICKGTTDPGLLLNEGSYLCKQCFENVSLIQYPEKYENLWRKYLTEYDAHKNAKESMLKSQGMIYKKSFEKISFFLFCVCCLLTLWKIGFLVLAVLFYWASNNFKKAYKRKNADWDKYYPQPAQPILRHFHDPEAELSSNDKLTLYIFNHWPGYPPFWNYLREIVLSKDNGRCQVTGCPSRLGLHIHHIRPVSGGGEHSPNNLVTLCDFHHALEPEKGHERIWGNIKTRYFTLVCEHERSNRAISGSHVVRPHLRRLKLISLDELRDLTNVYGFICPNCSDTHIKFTLFSTKNLIRVECLQCKKSIDGAQELTEETGPRLAELLAVTRNNGRWNARWEMLSERKENTWGDWKSALAIQKRKYFKERILTESEKPLCPICSAPTRLIRPRSGDSWKPFWGCTKFKVNGCKGSVKYNV